ncbi:MAG: tRNA adenosine(34) deaminase TadA [Dissulfurispiraceae bacterium]|jgi:tRNA(adenine34) deaminase|nr:tRNA adenosine(34) deaminase TadA [Dissulfurispiraceae bacterium]
MDRLAADTLFMTAALEEAHKAYEKGEVPIGAVVVMNGNVISRSHNLCESMHDPTAHAETLAIRQACAKINNWRLTGATVYVTKEPCIMCSGVIINSRLSRLVYGCSDSKGGGVSSLYQLLSDSRLNHQVEITSGLLEAESMELLRSFFSSLRQNSLNQ